MSDKQSTRALSTCGQEEGKLCEQHECPLQFVCSDGGCRKNALLCSECLPDHRDHCWHTLTAMHRQLHALSKTHQANSERAEKVERDIKTVMGRFKRKIDRKAIQLEAKIGERVGHIRGSFEALSQCKQVDPQNVVRLLSTLQVSQQQSQSSIEALQKFVNESIKAAQAKIVTILSDIQLAIDVNWLRSTPGDRKATFHCLKERMDEPMEAISVHEALAAVPASLRFDPVLKHPGISLSEDGSEACYGSNAVKGPAVILSGKVAQTPTFTFQIVRLAHTAFFFPDTTIVLGLCHPTIVKAAGLRRINQLGKGAYLIGSTGWAYHHSLPQFDRKNVVGWRFTEGDRITVEVSVETASVRFVKQGFFFDSEFRMPLGLNKSEVAGLQPCIGFDADLGAVVKVIRPPLQ